MAQAKKIKIGVLYSSEKPRWGSCVSISANLRASYAKLENDYEIHWLPIDSEKYQNDLCLGNGYIMGFAEGILKSKITKICFIDHHLKILPLLQALKIIEPQKWSKLEKIFHVYGDFTYFALDWQQTSPLLIGSHTALLCASDRQKDLVSFFGLPVSSGFGILSIFGEKAKPVAKKTRPCRRTSDALCGTIESTKRGSCRNSRIPETWSRKK